ncbi:MAG: gamma-glutamyltransferase [Bacteroidota bacterium]|nr:gamma-glutamyltransferase [Bacteroidota bacterium]
MKYFLRSQFLILIFILHGFAVIYASIPNRAKHGMVVSAHHLASEVGVEIMKNGGNAVDAAVAVGFALAVVFPEAGNIGGGGFMLIRKNDGEAVCIDFREKAPKSAWRDMYLDGTGNISKNAVRGHLSVGVPGTVAGLLKALDEFGTMRLKDIIQPAIDLAKNGFVVDHNLSENLKDYEKDLREYESTVETFFNNGQLYIEGDTLRQPQLARTLERIQKHGANDFYQGETAQLIIEEVKKGGGLITEEDLENYQAVIRKPLTGTYRDYEIISIPPPSSGGLCLLELLNILEIYDLGLLGYRSSRSVHIMVEAMKQVYADRAEFMGDPEFISIPIETLISKEYANERRKEIDTSRAKPSSFVTSGKKLVNEPQHTTHYSVVDSFGNCVSVTYTLNDLFGSQVVVDGAGFFLNNEMDDFSSKPGVPNSYGLIGSYANSIEGGKRPLSSMTPTIVLKDGKPIMILGARGGSRIITAVLQIVINVIDYGMNIRDAVNFPRFHHQWLPDELIYEKYSLPDDVLQNLRTKGHTVKEVKSKIGALEVIFIDQNTGWIYGAPDQREGGTAVGF